MTENEIEFLSLTYTRQRIRQIAVIKYICVIVEF